VLGVFIALALVVYGRSLSGGFVTWDDPMLVTENPNITSLDFRTLKAVFTSYDPELYIPLTFVSYQLDHLAAGMNPMMFRVTGLALHTLNAGLVSLILFLLFGSGTSAVLLGALYLVHPLNAEAVAWISARKDLLSGFFFLASLSCYLLWRSAAGRKWYVLTPVFLLLALLSKVMAVTLPVTLLLVDLLEGRRDWPRMLKEKAHLFALSFVFGIVALFGKTVAIESSTFLQKALMAAMSTAFYVWKFFLPFGLSFAYPYNGPIALTSSAFWLPIATCIALAGLAWAARRTVPLLTFGLAFFIVTLVPTFTNFYKGGDVYFASDRYVYIPILGLLTAAAAGLQHLLRRTSSRAQLPGIVAAGAATLVAAGLAAAQAQVWQDSFTLYSHAIRHYPESRAALHNLGMEYLKAGMPEEALTQFALAQSVKDDPRTRVSRAAALVSLKKYDEARSSYLSVIGSDRDEPDAYYGLGNIEYRLGRYREAIPYYRKALEAKPDYTNALNNLGGVYIALEDWRNAIQVLEESVRIRPGFPESHYNLGGAYEADGRYADAERSYRAAVDLDPEDADALASLATLVYARGEIDEAAGLLQRALQSDDANPAARRLLEKMRRDGVAS
jgi:protein O-mannosyl-transferase